MSKNTTRVGTHPAFWATTGKVTLPGPVVLQIRSANPPQNEISFTTLLPRDGAGPPFTLDVWLRTDTEDESKFRDAWLTGLLSKLIAAGPEACTSAADTADGGPVP